jgi:hypothetical protein
MNREEATQLKDVLAEIVKGIDYVKSKTCPLIFSDFENPNNQVVFKLSDSDLKSEIERLEHETGIYFFEANFSEFYSK